MGVIYSTTLPRRGDAVTEVVSLCSDTGIHLDPRPVIAALINRA